MLFPGRKQHQQFTHHHNKQASDARSPRSAHPATVNTCWFLTKFIRPRACSATCARWSIPHCQHYLQNTIPATTFWVCLDCTHIYLALKTFPAEGLIPVRSLEESNNLLARRDCGWIFRQVSCIFSKLKTIVIYRYGHRLQIKLPYTSSVQYVTTH